MGSTEREVAKDLGIMADLDLREAMADFYVLERLEADGSKRAAERLRALERTLAPNFARYLAMICGGELRHMPRVTGQEDYYEEECYDCPLDCGCESWSYHEDQTHEHNEDCVDPDYVEHEDEADCPDWYKSKYDRNGWCQCELTYVCDLEEGPQCGDQWPNVECECRGGSGEWEDYCSPRLAWAITDMDGSGRNAAWREWMRYLQDQPDPDRAMHEAYRAFADAPWDGGYGGEAWATAAKLCADYMAGKVKDRTFIDRCWSLEHNGGNVFNKVWHYDMVETLGNMLVKQAADAYDWLVNKATPEVKRLWRAREDVFRYALEVDPIWAGVQRLTTPEEVEW